MTDVPRVLLDQVDDDVAHLDLVAVDKNNIPSTVVKDGYHTLERICDGIPADKCPKQ